MSTATPSRTTWKIDATHSQVEFAVRHMMIATVRGRFADVTGTVITDEADPTKAEVETARDDLLAIVDDFPFAGPGHTAAWLASCLTAMARFAIDGMSLTIDAFMVASICRSR